MTKCRLVLFFLAINVSGSSVAQTASLDAIVSEIQRFESRNDPKCYATASRLEDFMFGTPLEFDARSKKNDLQKELISTVWQTASLSTEASTLNADDILSAASAFLTYRPARARPDVRVCVQRCRTIRCGGNRDIDGWIRWVSSWRQHG